jgi:hypothetical protein
MADKQDTQDKIIPVGPGADDDPQERVEPVNEGAGEDYQYPEGEDEGSERRDAGDERTGHTEEEQDGEGGEGLSREQKRRRRKREKYDRDQRELNFLRSRNEALEREHSKRLAAMESRQTQSDVVVIDGRISQAENDVREAETLLQQAMDAKDSGAAVEALRVRDQLRDGLNQLKSAKQSTVRAAQERQTIVAQPAGPDPAVVSRAQEWARERNWFDPQMRDEDSAIAFTVERRLFQEGRLDPGSDEYWEEVDRRLAKRLPERYQGRQDGSDEDDDESDPPPRTREPPRRVNGTRKPSGPTIKVGGRERPLRKGEVYIDEDRKQAMIEAGVYDDPAQRERFLKSYQKYDREAGRRPR